jgi:DNA excision repair protein ERCC-2
MDYYRTLLGGEESDRQLQLPSPFPPENLAVLMNDKIRTDLKNRAGTLGEVVNAISEMIAGRQGNYLVYFPSYQYLKAALDQFRVAYP